MTDRDPFADLVPTNQRRADDAQSDPFADLTLPSGQSASAPRDMFAGIAPPSPPAAAADPFADLKPEEPLETDVSLIGSVGESLVDFWGRMGANLSRSATNLKASLVGGGARRMAQANAEADLGGGFDPSDPTRGAPTAASSADDAAAFVEFLNGGPTETSKRLRERAAEMRALPVAMAVANLAERREEEARLPPMYGPTQRVMNPNPEGKLDTLETLGEIGKGFASDPAGVTLDVGAQNAAQLAVLVLAVVGTRGAAAAGGASPGTQMGLAMGVGGGLSWEQEFGISYLDKLAEGATHEEAWQFAGTRAGIIGLMDAVSFKLAGDMVGKELAKGFLKRSMQVTTEVSKQLGGQAALGAGGEALAQEATQPLGEYNLGDIAAEGIGELSTAPVEVVSMAVGDQQQQAAPAPTPTPDESLPGDDAVDLSTLGTPDDPFSDVPLEDEDAAEQHVEAAGRPGDGDQQLAPAAGAAEGGEAAAAAPAAVEQPAEAQAAAAAPRDDQAAEPGVAKAKKRKDIKLPTPEEEAALEAEDEKRVAAAEAEAARVRAENKAVLDEIEAAEEAYGKAEDAFYEEEITEAQLNAEQEKLDAVVSKAEAVLKQIDAADKAIYKARNAASERQSKLADLKHQAARPEEANLRDFTTELTPEQRQSALDRGLKVPKTKSGDAYRTARVARDLMRIADQIDALDRNKKLGPAQKAERMAKLDARREQLVAGYREIYGPEAVDKVVQFAERHQTFLDWKNQRVEDYWSRYEFDPKEIARKAGYVIFDKDPFADIERSDDEIAEAQAERDSLKGTYYEPGTPFVMEGRQIVRVNGPADIKDDGFVGHISVTMPDGSHMTVSPQMLRKATDQDLVTYKVPRKRTKEEKFRKITWDTVASDVAEMMRAGVAWEWVAPPVDDNAKEIMRALGLRWDDASNRFEGNGYILEVQPPKKAGDKVGDITLKPIDWTPPEKKPKKKAAKTEPVGESSKEDDDLGLDDKYSEKIEQQTRDGKFAMPELFRDKLSRGFDSRDRDDFAFEATYEEFKLAEQQSDAWTPRGTKDGTDEVKDGLRNNGGVVELRGRHYITTGTGSGPNGLKGGGTLEHASLNEVVPAEQWEGPTVSGVHSGLLLSANVNYPGYLFKDKNGKSWVLTGRGGDIYQVRGEKPPRGIVTTFRDAALAKYNEAAKQLRVNPKFKPWVDSLTPDLMAYAKANDKKMAWNEAHTEPWEKKQAADKLKQRWLRAKQAGELIQWHWTRFLNDPIGMAPFVDSHVLNNDDLKLKDFKHIVEFDFVSVALKISNELDKLKKLAAAKGVDIEADAAPKKATAKPVTPQVESTITAPLGVSQPPAQDGKLTITAHGEDKFIVSGSWKPFEAELKRLGGSFYFRSTPSGWIFRNDRMDEVRAVLGDALSPAASGSVEVDNEEAQQVRARGEGALAGAPAQDVPEAPERGDAGEGAAVRAGADDAGNVGARVAGDDAGRSVGGDQGEVPDPSRGTGPGGPAAVEPAVRGADGSGERPAGVPDASLNQPAQSDNLIITDEDEVGKGGIKAKYRANIAAIKLLQDLHARGAARATPDEQAVLVRYVGWGGIPQAFDDLNEDWAKEYTELKAILPEDQYEAARRSTQDAHYTSPAVIKGMWAGLRRLGFVGGRVLEPSMGVGHFFGLMPTDLRGPSALVGVELDPITGGIAKYLYPAANISAPQGFQTFQAPDGRFDLVVGNPPFGDQTMFDPVRKKLNGLNIHTYFITKSLMLTRPGGVAAFVVSRYFMDSTRNVSARREIGKIARLVGVVRLPNTAFKENANTEVTTDIVFFQRLEEGQSGNIELWAESSPDPELGHRIPVNHAFHSDSNIPNEMLGTMTLEGSMYRGDEPTLSPDPAKPVDSLPEVLRRILPEKIMPLPKVEWADRVDASIKVPDKVKTFGYFLTEDGGLARKLPPVDGNDIAERVEVGEKPRKRMVGMLKVRDAARDLLRAEVTDEGDITALRKTLNKTYDGFVKEFGFINQEANKRVMRDDPDWPLISALEQKFDRGVTPAVAKSQGGKAREPSAEKADIFAKRVSAPYKPITKATSAKDALVASMVDKGRMDLEHMSSITGRSPEHLIDELGELAYEDPQLGWVDADAYLSGDVKKKLAQAQKLAAKDPGRWSRNVDALTRVIPEDINAADIDVRVGATWIPESDLAGFVKHLFGPRAKPAVKHYESIGTWSVSVQYADQLAMYTTWGTNRVDGVDVLMAAIENRQPIVYDTLADGSRQVNPEATANALTKVDAIKAEWKSWLWSDPERRIRLARIYNDRFNTNRERVFDGSHYGNTLPGANPTIRLRPTQRNAVWRSVVQGRLLLDHVVGAGKTFTGASIAMEFRRLGLARKPMIAVPNHLTGQWYKDFLRLYPGAKVLAPSKADFERKNRKILTARIATGDYDAIILSHSQVKFIEAPKQAQIDMYAKLVGRMESALKAERLAMRERGGRSGMSIKRMEKSLEKLQTKLQKLLESPARDDLLQFDELGVDMMLIDEYQEFKNLPIPTRMNRVAGLGNVEGSQRAIDMYAKTSWLLKNNNGRGVFPMTGTPIANSLAEMYTALRYLSDDVLDERGIGHFDAWASVFAEVTMEFEVSVTNQFKSKSRLRNFTNLGELLGLYRNIADVVTRKQLIDMAKAEGQVVKIPAMSGGKPTGIVLDRSERQASVIESLVQRAQSLKPGGPDNMLAITNDAKKVALDIRLVNPLVEKDPDNKVGRAAVEVLERYKKWTKDRGTQLVFCDLSIPASSKEAELKEYRELVAKAEQGDEEAMRALEDLPENYEQILSSPFSVYDELKKLLVAQGVPAEQIQFIHDWKTDERKQVLFAKMNSGEVRVLIGSTQKMGAGTNVQERLVALHHLDAPWRPMDVEQREGRIIRQGNALADIYPDFTVDVIRYVTERTFDAMLWQTLEAKAKFIEQYRSGMAGVRSAEDIGEQFAASAAELKAAASGDPRVFREVTLRSQLNRLENEKHSYDRDLFKYQDSVATWPKFKTSMEEKIAANKADVPAFAAAAESVKGDKFAATINGVAFTKRVDAAALLVKLVKLQELEQRVDIGSIGGVTLTAKLSASKAAVFGLKGKEHYTIYLSSEDLTELKTSDGQAMAGLMKRIENIFEQPVAELAYHEKRLLEVHESFKAALERIEKPFPKLEELERVKKEWSELKADLQKSEAEARNAAHAKAVQDAKKVVEDRRSGQESIAPTPSRGKGIVSREEIEKMLAALLPPELLRYVSVYDNWAEAAERNAISEAKAAEHDLRGARGLWYNNHAFVIASLNNSVFEAAITAIHELRGHAAFDNWATNNLAEVDRTLRGIHLSMPTRWREYIQTNWKTNDPKVIAAEYIAIMAERIYGTKLANREGGVDAGRPPFDFEEVTRFERWWSKLVKAIKDMLRAAGLELDISAAEVVAFVTELNNAFEQKQDLKLSLRAQIGYRNVTRQGELQQRVFEQSLKALSEGRPFEAAFRAPFDVVGYIGRDGKWNAPESVRALGRSMASNLDKIYRSPRFQFMRPMVQGLARGFSDHYGVSPEFVKRLDRVELDRAALMLEGREFFDRMVEAGIDVNEAAVFQQVMSGKAIAPERWSELALETRAAIDQMSMEAVELGLIDEKIAGRNMGEYLHRSYLKHELGKDGLTKAIHDVIDRRRARIVGSQFKHRGVKVDPAPSHEQLMKHVPESYTETKRRTGVPDPALVGKEFTLLELWSKDKTDERGETVPKRLVRRVFWPKGMPVAEKFANYTSRGDFKILRVTPSSYVMWRDFTEDERLKMGQILDARYNIVKTYMHMAADLATGRLFRDIAANPEWARPADDAPPKELRVDDPHRLGVGANLDTFGGYEWVKVPESKVANSGTPKYGKLAGMYVRAEIWVQLNQLEAMQSRHWWDQLMREFKKNKTTRSPVAHFNNTISNFLMMELADIRTRDLVRGLVQYVKQDEHYKDAQKHGAFGSDFVEYELKRNVLEPILQDILKQNVEVMDEQQRMVAITAILSKALAGGLLGGYFGEGVVGAVAGAAVGAGFEKAKKVDAAMARLYQMEDEIFRMATYMRNLDRGMQPEDAALDARAQYLNYNIRAPYINALRRTILPFAAYWYRAIPKIAENISDRPWKLAKLITVFYILGHLPYWLGGDGDDDWDEKEKYERSGLQEQQSGLTWIGAPRMVRLPYYDQYGNPYFYDIRRNIPLGDIFDMEQYDGAIVPAPFVPNGLLLSALEVSVLNRSVFTDKQIVDETDTLGERIDKRVRYAYQAFMPTAPYIPGSYYWNAIKKANGADGEQPGKDWYMRDYSVGLVVARSLGPKVYAVDVERGRERKAYEYSLVVQELKAKLKRLANDRARNLVDGETFAREQQAIEQKINLYTRALQKDLGLQETPP